MEPNLIYEYFYIGIVNIFATGTIHDYLTGTYLVNPSRFAEHKLKYLVIGITKPPYQGIPLNLVQTLVCTLP